MKINCGSQVVTLYSSLHAQILKLLLKRITHFRKMYDSDTYLSTISRENSVQLGTYCTTIELRHLSFSFGYTRIPLTQPRLM